MLSEQSLRDATGGVEYVVQETVVRRTGATTS
jgi:hypothetical protein